MKSCVRSLTNHATRQSTCGDWYLALGMRVALGKTLVDIATELHNIAEECDDYFSLQLCKVALYLDKHYDTNNWAGR